MFELIMMFRLIDENILDMAAFLSLPCPDKGVFLQLRNEFEFPTKTIFTNISTGIGVTAISYL